MQRRPKLPSIAIAMLAALAWGPARADAPDRDRAQLMQLQQQLQRVQSDNAALQRKQGELQEQAQEAERLKGASVKAGKDLERSRADAASRGREAERLRVEFDAFREQTNAQFEQWKKALEERDAALVAAAGERRRLEGEVSLLGGRLKAQTGRADLCETRHTTAMHLASEFIDLYEKDRLRLCEPITGIWKVGREREIATLRERLYEARLDIPPSAPVPAAAPTGTTTESR